MAKDVTTIKIDKTTREVLNDMQSKLGAVSANDTILKLIDAHGVTSGVDAAAAMEEIKRVSDNYQSKK